MRRINGHDKGQGTLIGWRGIAHYLGVCERTACRLSEFQGLPIAKFPDKRVFTSKLLIDRWILARSEMRTEMLAAKRQAREQKAGHSQL